MQIVPDNPDDHEPITFPWLVSVGGEKLIHRAEYSDDRKTHRIEVPYVAFVYDREDTPPNSLGGRPCEHWSTLRVHEGGKGEGCNLIELDYTVIEKGGLTIRDSGVQLVSGVVLKRGEFRALCALLDIPLKGD